MSDSDVLADVEQTLADEGITARALEGTAMHRTEDLFTEFARRLEFPGYFGRNWPALSDCIRDLAWLPGFAYALVIGDSAVLLDDESEAELEVLFRTLDRAAQEWSEPVELGEWWDRPSVPFHVILHEAPARADLAKTRLDAVGVHPADDLFPR